MVPFITFTRYTLAGISQFGCTSGVLRNYTCSLAVLSCRKLVPYIYDFKPFSNSRNDDKTGEGSTTKGDEIGSVSDSGKYKPFNDDNSSLILDVNEERLRIENAEEEERFDEFAGLNLKRGVTGVFDIDDLVAVLRKESAEDIFVASLPSHLQYVDYIVVASGKSLKHMLGLAEFIRRLYKIKRSEKDAIPRIEGEASKDWLAIDLGNIALHILSSPARPIYDIESLWAVGKEYDEKCSSSEDSLSEILKKHAVSLDDFEPANSLR